MEALWRKAAEELAADVLAFLKRQWLQPTPQNYTLVYLAKAGLDPAICRAIEAITDDGVRMTQTEADQIFAIHLGAVTDISDELKQDDDRAVVRHQVLRLAEIAADAAAATGDFNHELSAGFEQIGGGTADAVMMIAKMIERSRRAERELAATVNQVESLRQELDSARDDATKDMLTGLGNRRAIEDRLARLASTGGPRLIAICDIDHFKSINDRYGHAVGDRVLKVVADALAEACAPHMVGRWGGEEFLVIMPAIELDEGRAILDAAREQVSARHFKLRETDEPIGSVTFSAGLSHAVGDNSENGAAIMRADAFLYRAKAEGRNRTIIG